MLLLLAMRKFSGSQNQTSDLMPEYWFLGPWMQKLLLGADVVRNPISSCIYICFEQGISLAIFGLVSETWF